MVKTAVVISCFVGFSVAILLVVTTNGLSVVASTLPLEVVTSVDATFVVLALMVTASVVVRGSVAVFLVVDGSVATVFTSVGGAFCSTVVTSTVVGD